MVQKTAGEDEIEISGYKESAAAKKGIQEIMAADAEDESLRRYKEVRQRTNL